MTSPEVFVTSVAEVERARPRHESSSSDGTTVTADLVEEVTAEDLVSSATNPCFSFILSYGLSYYSAPVLFKGAQAGGGEPGIF